LKFRAAASADVEEAYAWYEEQREGLGDEFRAAIDVAVDLISNNPKLWAVVHRDMRRILLRRFPYGLFYRIVGDELVVVACAHVRRHPKVWRLRR
jgi:plasmid stabilization system protein ParE